MADQKAPTPPPGDPNYAGPPQRRPDPPPPPPRKIPDGGEAFARSSTNYCDGARGMSLRDYFAAAALPGVLELRAVQQLQGVFNLSEFQEDIADECWQLADALLARRDVNQDRE